MCVCNKPLYFSVSAFILSMGCTNAFALDTSSDAAYLNSLEQSASYQVASITWLPDYDENEKTWGKYIISGGDGGHGKGDGCDSKYNLTTCPTNGDCDKCATNTNKLYFKGCKSGYKAEPAGSQNCILDCIPDPECKDYTLGSTPDDNAEYKSCDPGCNQNIRYKKTGCKAGYYDDENETCIKCTKTQTKDSCPEGKTIDEETSCKNEDGVTVGECIDCLETKDCFNHTLCAGEYDVPSGHTCECGGKTYHEICTRCDAPDLEGTCPAGKEFVYECTRRNGKKYGECMGCNAPKRKCAGFYLCGEDTIGDGATCDCDGTTYHERCLVNETCLNSYRPSTPEENCASGIWTRSSESCWANLGYYLPPSTTPCTSKIDGKQYWPSGYISCNASNKDDAPCKGFLEKSSCNAAMGIKEGTQTCTCGGQTFYQECKDRCHNAYRPSTPEEDCASGIWYRTIDKESCWPNLGYYLPPSTTPCTSDIDGKQYWPSGYTSCNASNKDDAPCKNFPRTPSSCKSAGQGAFVGGDVCECGGSKFYTACLVECNYEETPESCKAQGKEFIFHCAGEDDIQHGECL